MDYGDNINLAGFDPIDNPVWLFDQFPVLIFFLSRHKFSDYFEQVGSVSVYFEHIGRSLRSDRFYWVFKA